MPAFIDRTNKVYGNLIVLKYAGQYKSGGAQWLCRCTCGTEVIKSAGALKNGVKSCSPACGVSRSNALRAKHGDARGARNTASRHKHAKEYQCWKQMKNRCYNPNMRHYARYGGRGVTVAPQWLHSYETFLNDVGRAPSVRHTLDRIDNNKGYEPDNVRWATKKEQALNRETNVRLTYGDQTMTMKEWSDHLGIAYYLVCTRHKANRTIEEILGITPIKQGRPPKNKE